MKGLGERSHGVRSHPNKVKWVEKQGRAVSKSMTIKRTFEPFQHLTFKDGQGESLNRWRWKLIEAIFFFLVWFSCTFAFLSEPNLFLWWPQSLKLSRMAFPISQFANSVCSVWTSTNLFKDTIQYTFSLQKWLLHQFLATPLALDSTLAAALVTHSAEFLTA